jgi:uridine kinase
VEGVRTLSHEFAPLYDHRTWLERPRAVRLTRGIVRDGEAARVRWESDGMSREHRYIQQHRPREAADLVVDGSGAPGLDSNPSFILVCTGTANARFGLDD